MAIKRFTVDWKTPGLTVYGIIVRELDGYLLNDADGTFAISPADPYISFSEHLTIIGRYYLNESRTAWDDGDYSIAIYRQSGASPSPAADTIIGSGHVRLYNDLVVGVPSYPTGSGGITLLNLVTRLRRKLDDEVAPYLWSNYELTDYINEILNEACVDIPLIEDSTTAAICQYSLSQDDAVVTVDARITIVKKAKLASQTSPLTIRDSVYMDSEYGDWLNEASGEPSILVAEGVGTAKIRLYPPTSAADTLWLTVYRKQIADMNWDTDQNAQPEIPALYHDRLFNGVLSKAYMKNDADTLDEKRARHHANLWLDTDKEAIRRGVLKSRQRPEVVSPHPGFI